MRSFAKTIRTLFASGFLPATTAANRMSAAARAAVSPTHSRTSGEKLYKLVKPYTFASPAKLANLRGLACKVRDQDIPGDVVECGTYRGGSAAILGTTLSAGQRLWLFDSFQGMPPVTSVDGTEAGQYVGKGVASEQEVMEILTAVGVAPDQYYIRKGWFNESFQLPLPERIAFLHCDADWFESVLLVLESLYPRVQEGGCIVLDDFGYWEGCREAFYTFCCRHKERPLLERFGIDQAYWFKGRAHNRQ
jgi:O-methyltransferase